jgi:hypothetical protein
LSKQGVGLRSNVLRLIKEGNNSPHYVDDRGNIISKRCTGCKEFKILSDFSPNKKCLGGMTSRCKECLRKEEDLKRRKRGIEPKNATSIQMIRIEEDYVEAKNCRKCNELKPLTEFYKGSAVGGRETCCIPCSKENYHNKKRENALKKAKLYRQENKELISERKKLCYLKRIEHYKDKARKYREDHPGWKKEYDKKYAVDNVEKVKLYKKKSSLKRRAIEQNLPSNISLIELKQLESIEMCCISGKHADLALDHFIPISWGHGGSIKENLVPVLSHLNCSKGSKNPFEWIRRRKDVNKEMFDAVVEHLARINWLTVSEFTDYVYWCFKNRRSNGRVKKDNQHYGYKVSSIELWRTETGTHLPLPQYALNEVNYTIVKIKVS